MSELVGRRLREILHLLSYLRRKEEEEKGKEKKNPPHIKDVARALGVPPAEARRLIGFATCSGKAPFDPSDLIEVHVDARDRVHLHLDQKLGKPLRLSRQEALAFVVALRAVREEGDLGPAAESAKEKLVAALSEPVAGSVAALEARIALEGEDRGITGRLETLRRGLDEKRAVDIVYYTASRDSLSSRRIRPYTLLQHLGQWYVVGRDSSRKDIRVFKVERIREARLTGEGYQIPASFKPERYKKKGRLLVGRRYQTARVRFYEPSARVIREEWPADLIEDGGDGTVIGILHYVSGEGLANWLLGHGGAAEVLEPAELRDAVLARAKGALDRGRYGR